MDEEWISLREFARRMGVCLAAVQSALRNGRVVRREVDKKFHWPSQERAWHEFRDGSKVRDEPEEPDEDEPTNVSELHQAKIRKEVAIAGLKELELKAALGEMVKSSHVRAAMAQFAIDVREAVMTVPDRVASELAAEIASLCVGIDLETALEMVHRVWRIESRKVLETIASAQGERG